MLRHGVLRVRRAVALRVAAAVLAVVLLAAFVTGFVLAYVRSWRLALAMSSIIPCIAITGGVMNKFVSKYMQYVYSHICAQSTC